MARFSRRKRRLVQNGVNAIFSGEVASRQLEEEIEPNGLINSAVRSNREKKEESQLRSSRILVALFLIGIGLTVIGSGFVFDQWQQVSGPSGPSPRSPVRAAAGIAPRFYSVSNMAEMVVLINGFYNGTIAVATGDFLVVQIAYSEGSSGNLPDISSINDSVSSAYSRVASASPGVGSNFWEQVWTGRASSSSTTTSVMVVPDWRSCLEPCVNSIIISMTIALYRDVGGVGASAVIATNASSTSQSASIAVAESGSVLVELLSHGAYNNCGEDDAQPRSGQTSRNCFTGTTERTEFFDHPISSPQVYAESYTWAQVEVQRGIYLELNGSPSSRI